jgi:hypothetical protein
MVHDHNGICSDDDIAGTEPSDGHSLLASEPFDEHGRRLTGAGRLIDVGGLDVELIPGASEEIGAAGRL